MKAAMLISGLLVVAALLVGSDARDRNREFPEVETQSSRQTVGFSNPSLAGSVAADNFEGAVRVVGYDGSTVEVETAKTIRARSKEDLDRAKREVELEVSEKNNRIDLYVDGPFRCENGGERSRRLFYRVRYDFELKVPRKCDLDLRTINDGDITVEGVDGKFDVENINGRIRMNEIAGAGRAHAVNGEVKLVFSRAPTGDCSFSSLNGDVDVAFPPDLSADCWFKTFNGDAYTDFGLRPLPQPAGRQDRRDGKFVYGGNRFYGGRVARGGLQIRFATLNGSIHVTSR